MNLRELLGSDYKEGMTAEEIAAALSNKNFVSKETFDKTASDLAGYKRENENLKGANQTAEQKLEDALAKAEKQAREYTTRINSLEVEQILAGGGMKREEYADILGRIVSEDAEKSRGLAESIVAAIKAQVSTREQALRAELLDGSPKPSGKASKSDVTKEVFDQMTLTEKMKLKAENPEVFSKLSN